MIKFENFQRESARSEDLTDDKAIHHTQSRGRRLRKSILRHYSLQEHEEFWQYLAHGGFIKEAASGTAGTSGDNRIVFFLNHHRYGTIQTVKTHESASQNVQIIPCGTNQGRKGAGAPIILLSR